MSRTKEETTPVVTGAGPPAPQRAVAAEAPTPLLDRGEVAHAPWPVLVVPEPGQRLAGRYTVLEKLGEGGMGVVLAAYDSRLDRRVALKLLKPVPRRTAVSEEQWKARLMREAQAMARLSHPHVVAVYDAGELERGALYIAMEYVEGRTLRAWSQEQERSWREVLGVYVQAGRGLAAAHAAGLVHRDFKPGNVLVGRDGRVRVTDFGVARAEGEYTLAMPTTVPLSVEREDVWQQELTLPGHAVGTPWYMAPEVLGGQAADARSDLFSYCVALYEALYRQPAFSGQDQGQRLRAQAQGQVSPLSAKAEVPGWVGRAVLKGLSVGPGQRPANMEQLLAILEDDPEARRWTRGRVTALTGAGVVLAGLAVWGWTGQRAPGCGHLERRLSGVWDEQVRTQVRQSLVGTGLVYAKDTAKKVEALLDSYAGQWVGQSQAVCEAGGGPVVQGRSLRALQEACLERRRSQLGALTQLLTREPDKELVPKAVQAVMALPPLSYCMDEKSLLAEVPPPEDPAVRARVEALQPRVDELQALFEAGKYKQGVAQGEQVLAQVREVDFAPLQAWALYSLARLKDRAGDLQGAEALTRQAVLQAATGQDRVLHSYAWSHLLWVVGYRQGRPQQALDLELAAQAAMEHAAQPLARARALGTLGIIYDLLGRYEQALEHYERALAQAEQVLGPRHPYGASILSNMGLVLFELGRHEQAVQLLERSLALREELLGSRHPEVATSLNNLGLVLSSQGHYEEALERYAQALAIEEEALGPRHPSIASSLTNMADVLRHLGHYRQALEQYERALALKEEALGPEHVSLATCADGLGRVYMQFQQWHKAEHFLAWSRALREKALGAEHPDVAASLLQQADLLSAMGRHAEAQAGYERVRSLWEKALGAEHPNLAYVWLGLGRVSVKLREWGQARQALERAQALWEKAHGAQGPSLAWVLLGWGELHLAQGHPEQAVPVLERGLELARGDKAELRLTLAQALWDSGQDRPRAVALVTEVHGEWQRMRHPGQARLAQWLASHRLP